MINPFDPPTSIVCRHCGKHHRVECYEGDQLFVICPSKGRVILLSPMRKPGMTEEIKNENLK